MTTHYQQNVFQHLARVLEPLAPLGRALDFGSGDGWMAQQLERTGLAREVVGVDVGRRRNTLKEPVLYDGGRLPFEDGSFDLVYAVDVFHHTPDPLASINDALRCSSRYFLLKDHTYRNRRTKFVISVLDEIGNRRFGVPSLYKYQKDWDWLPTIESAGFAQRVVDHPIVCERRPVLRWVSNSYQFIGMWERISQPGSSPTPAASSREERREYS